MRFFLIPVLTLFVATNAFGYVCAWEHCQESQGTLIMGCSDQTLLGCVYGMYASTCNTCNFGWERVQTNGTMSGGCTYTYYKCERSCTGCTNCTGDADWSAHSTGYQKKVNKTCSCNTCSTSTAYRCAAGYYGSSTNGTSGCTACPSGGTSVAGSNTTITNCYATSGSDSTGSYTFTSNCYYTD